MKKMIMATLLASVTAVNASDIILSKAIKSDLRDKIERDLDVLENLKFKDASPETLKLLEVPALNAQTAAKWLGTRVNYVIAENALSTLNLLVKKTIFLERSGVIFPNAGIIPYGLDPANKAPQEKSDEKEKQAEKSNEKEKEVFTVMSNMGAAIYLGGKMQNQVYGLKVSRGLIKSPIKVLAESPRVGVIQIGEGLFHKGLTLNNENPNSIVNSINRLATFFHEARHSDGNGVSLGFTHSICPKGHDYAGEAACDDNLNGPYTVGAVMTKEMLKACEDSCTEKEKQILKLVILDSQSRVMKVNPKGIPTTEWDAKPESL